MGKKYVHRRIKHCSTLLIEALHKGKIHQKGQYQVSLNNKKLRSCKLISGLLLDVYGSSFCSVRLANPASSISNPWMLVDMDQPFPAALEHRKFKDFLFLPKIFPYQEPWWTSKPGESYHDQKSRNHISLLLFPPSANSGHQRLVTPPR